jgi:hypothetical protein
MFIALSPLRQGWCILGRIYKKVFDIGTDLFMVALLQDKLSTIRRLAKASFSPTELEYLVQHASFRLIYDSSADSTEAFETLCLIGEDLLRKRIKDGDSSLPRY